MSEFIKLSKLNNQGIILNLRTVVYFAKITSGTEIILNNSEKIEVSMKFEDFQDLLNSNNRMMKNIVR